MKISLRYGTHLPVLMQALGKSHGNVLELGIGTFSTPYLHWACERAGRRLVSMDNEARWTEWAGGYEGPLHKVVLVEDWSQAAIEENWRWSVVLVDHSPSERRVEEIRRLANKAEYLVVHDSNGRYEKYYHYSTVYPLFKYIWTFDKAEPSTTVLSNFTSLEAFWE